MPFTFQDIIFIKTEYIKRNLISRRLFFFEIHGKFNENIKRRIILIKNIAKGYRTLFSSLLKVILLAVLCLGLGFLVVYPLWLFASSAPSAYTICMMVIIAVALLFLLVMSARKLGFVRFLTRIAKLVIVFGGIALCVHFVFNSNRIAALLVILAVFVLYGFLAFGVKKNEKKN